jgi:hypothetical protein
MKISKVPLTDSYFITLFEGGSHTSYGISTSGQVTQDNGKYLETNFMNKREKFSNHKMFGKVSELTEEKAVSVLESAGLDTPYINYADRTKTFDSALDSLKSFISENWDRPEKETWMIIPKPSKQLKGKKMLMEFEVGAPDFGHGNSTMELEVFMSPITKTSKSLKFSMRIPKFLYDKCMTDSNIKERPTQDYIEYDTIASLHSAIGRYVSHAHNIWELDKKAKEAKKVICINFTSTERSERDEWNHAYTGQSIDTSFNFFVAYHAGERASLSFHSGEMFSFKKIQSGNGTTEKGIKGIIDSELEGKRNWIRSRPQVIIDWTQEREDFLNQLEEKFRSLSVNLNSFLKDLNEEKLENLIQNKDLLKLN